MKKIVIMLPMLIASSVFADNNTVDSQPATTTLTGTNKEPNHPNQTIQPQSNLQAPAETQPNNNAVITAPNPNDGNIKDKTNPNRMNNDNNDDDDGDGDGNDVGNNNDDDNDGTQ